MKIKRMQLENFLGLTCDIKITDPVNVFLGFNGVGKTAILDAFEYGFTGKLPFRGVKVIKTAMDYLSTNGAGDMSVMIDTSEGPLIRGKTVKVPALHISKEQLNAVLNARRSISMDPSDRQKVFSSLFAGDASNVIKTYCEINGIDKNWTRDILSGPDSAQELAVQKRRSMKAGISLSKKDVETLNPIVHVGSQTIDLREYTMEKLVHGRTVNSDDRVVAIAALSNAGRLSQLTKDLKAAKDEYFAINLVKLGLAVTDDQTALCKADKKNQNSRGELSTLEAQALAETKTMEDLEKLDKPACPCCLQDINPNKLAFMIKTLEARIEIILKDIAKQQPITDKHWKAWNDASEKLRQTTGILAIAKNQSETLPGNIDKLTAAIATCDGADLDALQEKLNTADKAIANYGELIKLMGDYCNQKADSENLQKEIDGMEADLAMADKVDQALKPDGELRQEIMKCQKKINFDPEFVRAWDMDSLTVRADGTVELFNRPIELASQSEQYRASLMLTDLLSRESGASLLLIDGLDVLADTGGIVRERLTRWAEEYETVFINCAVKERPPAIPPCENVSHWWVENGSVIKI